VIRSRFVILLLVLSAVPAAAQDFARQRLDASPRHHEWVNVPAGERTVHAFVAYPERAGRAPAVIVIHENRGLTDWVRAAADRLAEAGYVAVAPDLLSGFDAAHGRTTDFADSDAARTAIYDLPPERVTADLKAVRKFAAALPAANGRVAVIGFCWGGGQAFRFATAAPGLAAVLVFYGASPPQRADVDAIRAPVYGFYGERDARITATVGTTQERMRDHGKVYEPVVYPGAGHAFMRQGDDPDGPDAARRARDRAWERVERILSGLK
jgi:carboxymethylenebutenolidase